MELKLYFQKWLEQAEELGYMKPRPQAVEKDEEQSIIQEEVKLDNKKVDEQPVLVEQSSTVP